MTDQEKSDFAWISGRLNELGPASLAPSTAPLANAAIQKLTAHANEVLPTMLPAYQAAQQKAADAVKGNMATAGPAAWKTLHARALSAKTPINKNTERGWLFTYGSKLPCGDCRQFFAQYLQTNPPDFTDYFAWTVGLHNAVNLKLKKPEVTLDQARALWAAK